MIREQTIGARSSRGANVGGRAGAARGVQNPARRARTTAKGSRQKARGSQEQQTWRVLVRALPTIGKSLLVICALILVVAGYRVAASASFFQARVIDVDGVRRASSDNVRRVIERSAAANSVWQLDVEKLSRTIEREPWVRTAIVSRVLPAGLRVRITEREPLAVVRTEEGKMMWVDADGVLLNAVGATDKLPAFLIRGWDEADTDAARKENRARLESFVTLRNACNSAGVVERVSEVNLADLRDVRAQLAGRDAEISLRLGESNYAARLLRGIETLDARRHEGETRAITYLDTTVGSRVIVGFNPHASSSSVATVEDSRTGDALAYLPGATTSKPTARQQQRQSEPRQAVGGASAPSQGIGAGKPANEKRRADVAATKPRDMANASHSTAGASATHNDSTLKRPRRVER